MRRLSSCLGSAVALGLALMGSARGESPTPGPSSSARALPSSLAASLPADSAANAAASVAASAAVSGAASALSEQAPPAPVASATEPALPSVGGRPVRGYARAGVVELGGSGQLSHDTNFTQVGLSPSFGWFFINYVELSLLPEVDYAKTGSTATTRYRMLVEPSFHSQLEGQLFAVFGAGVGLAYDRLLGAGLAVAPRAGLKIVVGGSGVLTLVFEYVYAANAERAASEGDNTQHSATYGVRGGYSIAW